MNTLLCISLALVCGISQVLGQNYALCSGNSDCNSIKGANCAIPGGCKKGYCQCPPGQYVELGGSSCVAVPTVASQSKLGASCTTDFNCGSGATCSPTCTCISGMTASSDGINCQAYSNGASCSSSSLCGNNILSGSCSSGSCACSSGNQWATGGNIGQPGACVSSSATLNVGQGQSCTNPATIFTDSSPKVCGANLMCGMCPEGGPLQCMSGVGITTATMVTVALATVLSLLFAKM